MAIVGSCGKGFYGVHDTLTLHDLGEDHIGVCHLWGIQTWIVLGIYEELACGGTRVSLIVCITGSGHGEGVPLVLKSCVLPRDLRSRLLGPVGFEATTLDHKIGNYPVEDQAIVETAFNQILEVPGRYGCLLHVKLDLDGSQTG